MKELSVIVAAQNAQETIEDCLSALREQNRDGLAEIVVVDSSRDSTAEIVSDRFQDVGLIKVDQPALIPELWACGAEQSTGRIVAFTTAEFIPDRDWISQILAHHQADYDGIGGAIENQQPASLTQWAIYFCRYTAYMLPFQAQTADQIAGDNAAYKRFVLVKYASLIQGGFWENTVNDRLRADGYSLLLSPAIKVRYAHSHGVCDFCQQRIVHGRLFGADRAAAMPGKKHVLYALASPLIPFIFLGRIVRRVGSKKRHLRELVLSSPLIALFVLCWSYGEFLGYLFGDRRSEEPLS